MKIGIITEYFPKTGEFDIRGVVRRLARSMKPSNYQKGMK